MQGQDFVTGTGINKPRAEQPIVALTVLARLRRTAKFEIQCHESGGNVKRICERSVKKEGCNGILKPVRLVGGSLDVDLS